MPYGAASKSIGHMLSLEQYREDQLGPCPVRAASQLPTFSVTSATRKRLASLTCAVYQTRWDTSSKCQDSARSLAGCHHALCCNTRADLSDDVYCTQTRMHTCTDT